MSSCTSGSAFRLALLLALLQGPAAGCYEADHSAGVIEGAMRDAASVESLLARQAEARAALPPSTSGPTPSQGEAPAAKAILFGDLHVHSTFSIDAFVFSLPVFGGDGAHPPADACDFARHCSQLDFFSINDHAESLTPARWHETIESIRQCNALAGDAANPDLVAYVGWEWTQVGETPELHEGHKNVIYPGLADHALPARPITALPQGTLERARALWLVGALRRGLGPLGLGEYADFLWLVEQMARTPDCAPGVDVRTLPADCRENAPTARELFEKLAQWQLDALVIPHGLGWGIHTPPGSSIATQLTPASHDPSKQRLLEVFSGHGSSEAYRDFAEFETSATGERICPAPTPDYLPCCWRAGELMAQRCGDLSSAECDARVAEARQLALDAGGSPHRVFPDTRQEDWLDCDQCRDCFKPAMNLRPGVSAQAALAAARSDEPSADGGPLRFRFGFIASTDNHTGRPGTGYKQYARKTMTDARGFASPRVDRITRPFIVGEQQDPRRAQPAPDEERGFRGLLDTERTASFMYPGGLVAVHARERDRDSIWQALEAREVYGTSGPRILLWFDLLNGPGGRTPMGRAVTLAEAPRFEVRAIGSFVQRPGCPDESVAALSAERLEGLCRGECYHPSDQRHTIDAIEVVRVRPRTRADEKLAELIDDPWRRFECPPDPAGCVVRFADPDYAKVGRDAVYYVRALQTTTPAVNAANLRTVFDADGRALGTAPCYGNYRTPFAEDCLAPAQERAWSSPIYVDRPLEPVP
ncbi:MAG: DUF3604 domain-containing protein [Deltaproteobacteria bacterium]|nr:DUF3604 domain-containing protein [Deltaproteobacteria bacterium]MBW2416909.1 DUF3604 domain-containing protein [Deltaproteobacteria bacterium]